MSINTVENNIIAQLKANITDLKIEGFPDKPGDYKLLHPKGAILVHFRGGSYSEPEENAFIQQTVNLEFELTLLVKGLRHKSGAYAYINSITSALTGFTPQGCKKMYLTKINFLNEKNGLWQYALFFTVLTENYS